MRLSADIGKDEIVRWLGRGRGAADLGADLDVRLDDAIDAVRRIGAPMGVWRRFPICGLNPVRLSGCALELPGADIAAHLEGASSVAVMAVTVGLAADREIRRRAAQSPLDALLFDTAASVATEAAADALNEVVLAEAGCRATERFSPGYGDLPLSVHPALLTCIDATRQLGITVCDSGLLMPSKSITAIIGLFDGEAAAAPIPPAAGSQNRADSQSPAPYGESGAPAGCTGCPNVSRCALAAAGRTCQRDIRPPSPDFRSCATSASSDRLDTL